MEIVRKTVEKANSFETFIEMFYNNTNSNTMEDIVINARNENDYLEVIKIIGEYPEIFNYAQINENDCFQLIETIMDYPENANVNVTKACIFKLIKITNNPTVGYSLELIRAARAGELKIVKFLAEAGFDVHANSDRALWDAAKNNHVEVVRFLKKYA